MTPADVINKIALIAENIGWHAGVGGMETAGSIVSYLAKHPDQIEGILDGTASVLDWPVGWHEQGRLTWQGMSGKVVDPADVRRHRLIKLMERGAA